MCSIIPEAWNIHTVMLSFLCCNMNCSFMVLPHHCALQAPLEFFFHEQSYSSFHSGRSLHGITFTAILTIPVATSPISAELLPISAEFSPIPAALLRTLRRSASTRSPMRRRRSLRDSLNIIKQYETRVKHCDTS